MKHLLCAECSTLSFTLHLHTHPLVVDTPIQIKRQLYNVWLQKIFQLVSFVAKIRILKQPEFKACALGHNVLLPILSQCISPLSPRCAWQVPVMRKKQLDYFKSKRLESLSSM